MAVTPCINVCEIDEETGYCMGCFRTREEIAIWSSLDEIEQLAIMETLEDRN